MFENNPLVFFVPGGICADAALVQISWNCQLMMLQALLEITKGVLTIAAYAVALSSCAKPTKTIAGEKPQSKKSESSSKGSSSKGSSSRHESSSDSKASDSKSSMSKYKTPTKKQEVQTGQDELVLSVVKPAPVDYSQVPADVVEKLSQVKTKEEKEKGENWLPLVKTQSLAVEPKSAKPTASKPRYQKKTHIVTVLAGEKRPTVLSAQPATPETAASKPATPAETPQPSTKEKGKPPPAPTPATPQPPPAKPPTPAATLKPPTATPLQPPTPAKTPPAAPAGPTSAKPSPYQPLATGKPAPPSAKPSPYQPLVTGKPATPTPVSPYQSLVTGKPATPTQPAIPGQPQPPKPPGAPGQPSGKPDPDKTNSQSTPLLV